MRFFKQIRKNALFADLNDKEIEQLFDCLNARIVKCTARDIVTRPSDPLNEICIILEGNLVEFVVGNNGDRKVVSSKVDGEMFGLPNCYSATPISTSFITAATDATLLYIEGDSIYSTCENACPCHKKLISNLLRYLSGMVIDLRQNKDFITIRGMRKKIATFIYDKYIEQGSTSVRLGVDRNGMAKYLNVSRPSMSREMINMREEGIFDFHKDLVQIKNTEALRKIAQE